MHFNPTRHPQKILQFRALWSEAEYFALKCIIFPGCRYAPELRSAGFDFRLSLCLPSGEALAEKKLQRTALAPLSYSGERNFFPTVPFVFELR